MNQFMSVFTELGSLHLRLHSFAVAPPLIHTVAVPLEKIFGDTTYPRLRDLHFDSMWLDSPEELCSFLAAHAGLETVELSNINIGGLRDAVTSESGLVLLVSSEMRRHTLSARSSHPGWLAVAETCQTLPRMCGLFIESPSVSEDWTYLSLFDTEELMGIAMNGRENKLYDGIQLGT